MNADANQAIGGSHQPKYGARVYPLGNGRALVKQTVKGGPNANDEYVIDDHRERHVDLSNDTDMAVAIREALAGQLSV